MKITAAIFHACVTSPEALPPEKLPVIALVGRSNVGKSSMINTLVGRREMAKTSSTPGKTLTINFYLINEQFFLVDLPGYGYSKASKVTRQRIQTMMDEFFENCPELKGVIQILDSRHPPSTLDQQMFAWLRERRFPFMAVLNKTDKLGQQMQKTRRQTLKELGSTHAILFSSKTRQGREEILESLDCLLRDGTFGQRGGAPAAEGEGRSRQRRRGQGGQGGQGGQNPQGGRGNPNAQGGRGNPNPHGGRGPRPEGRPPQHRSQPRPPAAPGDPGAPAGNAPGEPANPPATPAPEGSPGGNQANPGGPKPGGDQRRPRPRRRNRGGQGGPRPPQEPKNPIKGENQS